MEDETGLASLTTEHGLLRAEPLEDAAAEGCRRQHAAPSARHPSHRPSKNFASIAPDEAGSRPHPCKALKTFANAFSIARGRGQRILLHGIKALHWAALLRTFDGESGFLDHQDGQVL